MKLNLNSKLCWWWKKQEDTSEKEQNQLQKIRASQDALLNAATSTANAAQDVTSIIKQKLNDSLIQLEITGQMMSDALMICDSKGKIQSMNHAAERIFGWKVDQVRERSVELLFRKNNGSSIKFPAMMEAMQSSQNIHDTFDLDNPLDSLRGKRRNGELFWVDVHMNYMNRADGQYVMLIARDSTNRVETLKLLELNERRYRSVFERSFDGIMIVANQFVVDANPAIAKILGYTTDEMIAKTLTTFLHSDAKKTAILEHELRSSGDLSPRNYLAKGKRADGSPVELLVSTTGIQWGDGVAILFFAKDLTVLAK
jgi:PAS domain S-box-containing protein